MIDCEDKHCYCDDATLNWLNGIGERPGHWPDACCGFRYGVCSEDEGRRTCCDFCWLKPRCPYQDNKQRQD